MYVMYLLSIAKCSTGLHLQCSRCTFGSIFLLFPMKQAGGHVHSSCGN